ncbi:MAG TPA: peptidylprolyl isomerase [Caulobacteraceae bacterium]|jgi:peptidyl-prolyl cis-trans isomerase A (cyclophilin A)|nr:peptidylprolyl isomerase [Caulobacteraceae bacterium]
MDGGRIGRRSVLGAAGLWIARPLVGHAAAARKPRVAIQTGKGTIVVELETIKAPITAGNFLRYVDAMKYDGGVIYRASRTPGVAGAGSIQGGRSPTARAFRPIAHESTQVTGLRHRAGTISMGRTTLGSATSDFFICASALPYLDAHPGAAGDNQGFAAFGTVVEGMAVVKKILALPTTGKTYEPAMKGQMIDPPVQILGMKRL